VLLAINSGHLNVIEEGPRDRLPVVFLHGFPFSHAMWAPQTSVASSRFRTVVYDIRGHGMSDVGEGQYTIEGHVDDLIAILDRLGIDQAVIVGLSMGGYIALRALEREQHRFLGAVLCDTRSEGDTNEAKLKRFEALKAVKENGSAAFAEGFVRAVFAENSFHRHPEAVAMIRKIIERTPPLSIAGTLLALASRTDTTPSLPRISIPTLILVGEKDLTTPPEASRAMHGKIPGSELTIIPDAAHMSNLENTEMFSNALFGFLDAVAARRRRT
jgi:3-oxoadipate enol-lactonase